MNKLHSTRLILAAALLTLLSCCSSAFANLTHTVVRGDNLYRIGLKYGVSYKEIMRENNLERTTIHPNQVLLIPTKKGITTTSKAKSGSVFAQRPSNNDIGALPKLEKVKPLTYTSNQPSLDTNRYTQPHIPDEEDGLGLGYTPPSSSYPTPSYPAPTPPATDKPKASLPKSIVQAIPAPKSPSSNWNQPKQHTWSKPKKQVWNKPTFRREVPTAAQYSNQASSSKYPMPSFKANIVKPKHKIHTVKSGENGWKVSRCYNISLFRLRKANNLGLFQKIRPGMRLVVPNPR